MVGWEKNKRRGKRKEKKKKKKELKNKKVFFFLKIFGKVILKFLRKTQKIELSIRILI